jgi:hypothetical protein
MSPLRGESVASIEREDEGGEIDIGELDCGSYMSVVVASFGGVTQEAHSTRGQKSQPLKIHPFLMFLLCLPLFIGQMSIIVMLRLDCDLLQPVYGEESASDKANQEIWLQLQGLRPPPAKEDIHDLTHVTGVTMLKAKLLMVLILQLIFFSKLQNIARYMVFLMNPTTWMDVVRVNQKDVKITVKGISLRWLYHGSILAPIAILSLLMQFGVYYNVLVDSMSIILASDDVKSAIFNSLAVSFVGELSAFYLYFCSKMFHFHKIDHFKFKMATDALKKDLVQETCWPNGLDQSNKGKKLLGCVKFAWLHRGHGANRIEAMLVSLFMFCIYFRQFGVMLKALDSNILPVARDVCTFYHWQSSTQRGVVDMMFSLVFNVVEHLLVVSPRVAIDARGHRYCKADDEMSKRYDMITTSKELMTDYTRIWWIAQVVMVVFLIMPQVFYALNSQIRSFFSGSEENAEYTQLQENAK